MLAIYTSPTSTLFLTLYKWSTRVQDSFNKSCEFGFGGLVLEEGLVCKQLHEEKSCKYFFKKDYERQKKLYF